MVCKMIKHYTPIPETIKYLVDKYRHCSKILEIGPGEIPFPISTHSVDHLSRPGSSVIQYQLNICEDLLPFEDKSFDFVYCRHVLEDVHNPEFIFKEIKRVAKSGYIETPSVFAEMTRGVEGDAYRGYVHHRYFVWNNNDGIIKFLPKFPYVECLIPKDYTQKLSDNPFYWNQYFMWDEGDEIDYKMYYNDVDYVIRTSYHTAISNAIVECENNIRLFQTICGK
jgi:SAM-dependent methyltransferase